MIAIKASTEHFSLRDTFTISRGSRDVADVIRLAVTENGITGQGECVPYARYGETLASVHAQIDAIASSLSNSLARDTVQAALPAGAARNAVDCALWDLEAKTRRIPVHRLAAVPAVDTLTTAYTIGIADSATMQAKAEANADRPLLKIKLGTPTDLDLLRAVRHGAPNARLIIDANEAWSRDDYLSLLPELQALSVDLIEQPFHADHDEALDGLTRPIPVCADESCHDRASLQHLVGRYDMVNIKLDKTGGLTEALAVKDAALQQGFGLMVGCMVGSSLAMAPAQLIAQGADVVDLDGPLLLAEDREHAIAFTGSLMKPATPELWG